MGLEKLMINSSKELGVNLDGHMVDKFMIYKNMILEFNKNINLTSIVDEEEIILKHFIDSITPLKYLDNFKNISIIDVGTGAGFPGIPIKITKPCYKVTLLDSLNKRIKFLDEVIENLELTNTYTVHMRAEDAGKDLKFRENFDICFSRALSNMNTLCEYCLPFVKVGGKFIAFKGPNIEEELKYSDNAIKILGGNIEDILYINIPNTDIRHSLIIVSKIFNTSPKYPRKMSNIKNKPII